MEIQSRRILFLVARAEVLTRNLRTSHRQGNPEPTGPYGRKPYRIGMNKSGHILCSKRRLWRLASLDAYDAVLEFPSKSKPARPSAATSRRGERGRVYSDRSSKQATVRNASRPPKSLGLPSSSIEPDRPVDTIQAAFHRRFARRNFELQGAQNRIAIGNDRFECCTDCFGMSGYPITAGCYVRRSRNDRSFESSKWIRSLNTERPCDVGSRSNWNCDGL